MGLPVYRPITMSSDQDPSSASILQNEFNRLLANSRTLASSWLGPPSSTTANDDDNDGASSGAEDRFFESSGLGYQPSTSSTFDPTYSTTATGSQTQQLYANVSKDEKLRRLLVGRRDARKQAFEVGDLRSAGPRDSERLIGRGKVENVSSSEEEMGRSALGGSKKIKGTGSERGVKQEEKVDLRSETSRSKKKKKKHKTKEKAVAG